MEKLNRFGKLVLSFSVALYRATFKNLTGGACRFHPSCSEYAQGVLLEYNFFESTILITKRILKCNPFGSSGYDPVPSKNKVINAK